MDPTREEWGTSSVEFCGGTHVSNTREAEAFVITEESAVAKGIRRVRVFLYVVRLVPVFLFFNVCFNAVICF